MGNRQVAGDCPAFLALIVGYRRWRVRILHCGQLQRAHMEKGSPSEIERAEQEPIRSAAAVKDNASVPISAFDLPMKRAGEKFSASLAQERVTADQMRHSRALYSALSGRAPLQRPQPCTRDFATRHLRRHGIANPGTGFPGSRGRSRCR
jgi:hypothetical protein